MTNVAVLVVAAGRGRRFGGDFPKQYLDLDGRPVIRHCLATFAACPQIRHVRAVIHPDDVDLYQAAAQGLSLLPPVWGGDTRQDSVRLGLESLSTVQPDYVLIHDAARPFVDLGIIQRVIAALKDHVGVIPALPVADTLKRADGGRITDTVSRDGLWRAQTPQAFHFPVILAAHQTMQGHELTDDAAVAEAVGHHVIVVPGSEANGKITTRDDVRHTDRPNQHEADFCTGNGYDVHAFCDGDGVWLCGVHIPHTAALKGHSDADVALHALTDAILGAIAAGDIGHHFPPSDARWKGAASDQFVTHAVNLVQGLGGRIVHADVTIICERPKIGPHRFAMQQSLSGILGLAPQRVSVKATTTEGLGFTGRKEGIAAQATVTVRLPAQGV